MRNIILLFFFVINVSFPFQQEGIRIIYLIHGDGNYLFHDKEGNALNAAARILEQAKKVAGSIERGEVFIFYQKPPENNFLFFRSDDGEFYYYRNGSGISTESYQRENAVDFEIEAELLKKYSEAEAAVRTVLLYYGHQIPEENSSGYHSSYPEKEFGIRLFAEGTKKLLSVFSPGEKLDLLVLSTCRNGNPAAVKTLSSAADYIIASPADIHLSYLNSESLIEAANEFPDDADKIARSFAEFAYNKMREVTATEIFISLYDIKRITGAGSWMPEKGTAEFYSPPLFGKKPDAGY